MVRSLSRATASWVRRRGASALCRAGTCHHNGARDIDPRDEHCLEPRRRDARRSGRAATSRSGATWCRGGDQLRGPRPRGDARCGSASSTTTASRRATSSPSTRSASGTARARASRPARATASAPTGRGTPAPGLRFNPAKLLLDPYARAVSGELVADPAIFGYVDGRPRRPAATSTRRRTSRAAWSSTTTSTGATTADRARRWRDTVIYELHVKGMTAAARPGPRAPARHVRRAGHAGGDRLPAATSA